MLSWWPSILMSLSLCLSLGAVFCCVRVLRLLRGASARSLLQLSTEVAELQSACESLAAQQRRLAARVGMREVRQRQEEQREASASQTSSGGKNGVDKEALREQARARGLLRN